MTIACIAYAVLSSLFLLAQVVGFVVTQTAYSDTLEEAKYRMLENEEAEWRRS